MKKIVSIVLALVLVLAIAAPAMAITGYEKPVAPADPAVAPYTNCSFKLIQAPADGLGIMGIENIATNKAYVNNELIFWELQYTTPKADDITVAWTDRYDPAVCLTSDVVLFSDDVHASYYTTNSINPEAISPVVSLKGRQLTFRVAQPTTAPIKHIVVGSGVVNGAASGSILCEFIGEMSSPLFAAFEGITWEDINGRSIYDGLTKKYTIFADSVNYIVQIESGKYAGYKVGFTYDDSKKVSNVTNIAVGDLGGGWNNVLYNAPISGGGNVVESIGGWKATDTTGTYAALKGAYDEVMSFFGFDYNAAGLLKAGHFAMKLSTYYDKASIAVNLHTAAITVPDSDVDIPQTGDAATTLGFVMIAMAIVAAAAVAYKKVRA